MPNNASDLLNDLLRTLSDRMQVQVVSVHRTSEPYGEPTKAFEADATVLLRATDGRYLRLIVEELTSVYPRDVRNARQHLQLASANLDSTPLAVLLPIVIAQELSPGARELLREASINYYDESGTLLLRHGQWLIDIERPPKAKPRRVGSLFTGARERVVHAMLHHCKKWSAYSDGGWISGGDLARLSGASTFTVSTLMQELERQELVQTEGKGPAQRRRLSQPAQLLDQWAADWVSRKEERSRWYLYTGRVTAANKVMAVLDEGSVFKEWALTGAAAANALLPVLTKVEAATFIIPPDQTDDWASRLMLERTDKGANVVLIEREGASLMFWEAHPELPGSRFASPFIQYLDLLDGHGRHRELADEYRSKALKMEPRDVR